MARIDVNRPDDEHVVRTPQYSVVHGHDAPAGTIFCDKPCQISCPISDKGGCFLFKCCHNHFPHLSRSDRLKRIGVEYLQNIIISPVVNASVVHTIKASSRTIKFRQAGDVEEHRRINTGHVRNKFFHGITASFRPEYHFLERDLSAESPFVDLFGEKKAH